VGKKQTNKQKKGNYHINKKIIYNFQWSCSKTIIDIVSTYCR